MLESFFLLFLDTCSIRFLDVDGKIAPFPRRTMRMETRGHAAGVPPYISCRIKASKGPGKLGRRPFFSVSFIFFPDSFVSLSSFLKGSDALSSMADNYSPRSPEE